ncbi:uncharacterized protein BO95DRAFT_46470 [Aspergillus brunneoviolaceus CBS 621.78]|uniref:Uncharacterized protein n=1 Tax=Aspergillus brunneoviolaceus CBS 621.78 TaxID=1450534 RepID=A0ACD1FRN3_9EURO|nr:hypothetical protein BO95DRAFT_46470 [Aspergillus brunneoviolaceus CBS 621.78]RAH39644.1 hypothetical protein BO95DRAFT_46470 [Aspergillus brunneoviolaceus CBS 621.78]
MGLQKGWQKEERLELGARERFFNGGQGLSLVFILICCLPDPNIPQLSVSPVTGTTVIPDEDHQMHLLPTRTRKERKKKGPKTDTDKPAPLSFLIILFL